jgi:membrane protein DedA with SNARE-associated domain
MDAPTHEPETTSDHAPAEGVTGRMLRTYAWMLAHWPTSVRWQLAIIVVGVVFALAAVPLLARVAGIVINLGLLPYLALMILCWLGEGGALVPIPGVRLLSWVTIVQQGANLDPILVALLAAAAMAAGQTSYFAAARYGDRFASGRIQRFAHLRVPGTSADAADTAEQVDAVPPVEAGRSRRLMRGGRERLERAGRAVASGMRSHPYRTVFFASIIPNPITTLATLTAAMSGVPFVRYFLPLTAGFLIFCSVLAASGRGILAAMGL